MSTSCLQMGEPIFNNPLLLTSGDKNICEAEFIVIEFILIYITGLHYTYTENVPKLLTLKVLSTFVADGILKFFNCYIFRENKTWHLK